VGVSVSINSRIPVAFILCLLPGTVYADTVHLVGGSTIEGKASRKGDKVVIEVESGEIALSASEVEEIEAGPSAVQRFEAMHAKVGARDPKALLALANFCRDHDMKERERLLLLQLLELTPEQPEVRARLGYVKSDAGWVKREQQLRDQGFVHYDGRWLPRDQPWPADRVEAHRDAQRSPAQARPAAKRAKSDSKPLAEGDADMTARHEVGSEAAAGGADDPFENVR
jgi:hypothetical protein